VEWSLDGPLPKLCPVIPTSNQDDHQAKNRKKGGCNFNLEIKPKLHNHNKSTKRKITKKNPEYMVKYSIPCRNR
jgi:hypothetical protein